jgi:putative ABC transport system permease protein
MRSFLTLVNLDLGFDPDHTIVTVIGLPEDRYRTANQLTGFLSPLIDRLRNLPGVMAAAPISIAVPFGGSGGLVDVPGTIHREKWEALINLTSAGYFQAMGLHFLRGHPFNESEVSQARRVAVINGTFSRKYFGAENPIGRKVRLTALETAPDPVKNSSFEIVGVFADVMNKDIREGALPEIMVPYIVTGSYTRGVIMRTAGDPRGLVDTIRRRISEADKDAIVSENKTVRDLLKARVYAEPRFSFLLLSIFACIGLLLVTTGLYSILAYTVSQRAHEIGVRIALGADPTAVVGLVLWVGLRLIGLGVAIGFTAALALTRLLGSQVWHVSPLDPLTFAAVILLLFAIGLCACTWPARRAASVEPAIALRSE